MSKFITGNELNSTIRDIIWEAQKSLIIVSPFINLGSHFKELFDKHEHNHKLHIILIFGKNENQIHKSLKQEDFDYLKKFPNISIIYAPNLHAKYYGNENKGVVTSINLYDKSFEKNIEFGVYYEQTILTQLGTNPDLAVCDTCIEIAKENDVVFIKRPSYESKKFIINLSKNYIRSEVLHDSTDYFYGGKGSLSTKRLSEFPDDLEFDPKFQKTAPDSKLYADFHSPEKVVNHAKGFCIRTGETIPFNPRQPLSKNAWRTWSQFENYDYPENYCHQTGKPSYGKTSMNNPIL